jgi:hypothetical protein
VAGRPPPPVATVARPTSSLASTAAVVIRRSESGPNASLPRLVLKKRSFGPLKFGQFVGACASHFVPVE